MTSSFIFTLQELSQKTTATMFFFVCLFVCFVFPEICPYSMGFQKPFMGISCKMMMMEVCFIDIALPGKRSSWSLEIYSVSSVCPMLIILQQIGYVGGFLGIRCSLTYSSLQFRSQNASFLSFLQPTNSHSQQWKWEKRGSCLVLSGVTQQHPLLPPLVPVDVDLGQDESTSSVLKKSEQMMLRLKLHCPLKLCCRRITKQMPMFVLSKLLG